MSNAKRKIVAIVGSRPPGAPASKEQMEEFEGIQEQVTSFVESLPEDTWVVSGGAVGVDSIAAVAARKRGLLVTEIKPDYGSFPPKIAPLKRNETIAESCQELHAWPSSWSRGTWHIIQYAKRIGRKVEVHGQQEKQ